MTPTEVVARLLEAGFTFSVAADGDASFIRPITETAEADELLSIVAWRWDELELAVLQHLAIATPPAIHPPPCREQRAAG